MVLHPLFPRRRRAAPPAAPAPDPLEALRGENAALRARVAELEALLASATEPPAPPPKRRG